MSPVRATSKTPDLPPFLTVRQFCVLYQVSESTVRFLISSGQLDAQRVNGNRWLIKNDFWKHNKLPVLNHTYVLREIEAAELIGCTPRNVRYLCEHGEIRFQWKSGRRCFSVNDVHEYLKTRKAKKRGGPRPSLVTWAKQQLEAMDAET